MDTVQLKGAWSPRPPPRSPREKGRLPSPGGNERSYAKRVPEVEAAPWQLSLARRPDRIPCAAERTKCDFTAHRDEASSFYTADAATLEQLRNAIAELFDAVSNALKD